MRQEELAAIFHFDQQRPRFQVFVILSMDHDAVAAYFVNCLFLLRLGLPSTPRTMKVTLSRQIYLSSLQGQALKGSAVRYQLENRSFQADK